jgi:hypothetical protein
MTERDEGWTTREEHEPPVGVEVPWDRLEPDTLRRVIEEFITREGTDYGYEASLDMKVAQVRRQLEKGSAVIVFDPARETVSIAARE